MKVGVRLQAVLRRYRPDGFKGDVVEVELPDAATVRDAAVALSVPVDLIHAVFVNDRQAALDTPLAAGDVVRMFPAVAGGAAGETSLRVFIAGIMQGSRQDSDIESQDYRQVITSAILAHMPDATILDPWAIHPNSVSYDDAMGRRTFIDLCELAATADVLVAFVPEASMGTAIEIWQAWKSHAYVVIISPLTENWVVKFLSDRVLRTLDEFKQFVASGELAGAVRSRN